MVRQRICAAVSAVSAGCFVALSMAPVLADRMFPDEPQRPHVRADLMPNWGYNPTCWQRFPQVPACPAWEHCPSAGSPVAADWSPSFHGEAPHLTTPLPVEQFRGQHIDDYGPEQPAHHWGAGPRIPDSLPHNSRYGIPQAVPPSAIHPYPAPNQPVPAVPPALTQPEQVIPVERDQEAFPAPHPVPSIPAVPPAPLPAPSGQFPPDNGQVIPRSSLPPLPEPPVDAQSSAGTQRLEYGPDGRLRLASRQSGAAGIVSNRYSRPLSTVSSSTASSRYGAAPVYNPATENPTTVLNPATRSQYAPAARMPQNTSTVSRYGGNGAAGVPVRQELFGPASMSRPSSAPGPQGTPASGSRYR